MAPQRKGRPCLRPPPTATAPGASSAPAAPASPWRRTSSSGASTWSSTSARTTWAGTGTSASRSRGARIDAPHLVEAVHAVSGLPDAGPVSGLPAPLADPRVLPDVRAPLRRRFRHRVRHQRRTHRAGRRRGCVGRIGATRRRSVGDEQAGRRSDRQRPQLVPEAARVPGAFDGEVIHSANYEDPSGLRGKRVLVVGASNSGCDIAVSQPRTPTGHCIPPAAATGTRRSTRWASRVIKSTTWC